MTIDQKNLTELRDALPGLQAAATMQDIVLYLVKCAQQGNTHNFEIFFALVEEQIIFCDPEARERLIIDLLEDLKNQSSIQDLDYIVFENWLGPETHIAWRWLEKKWQGKGASPTAHPEKDKQWQTYLK